MKIDFHSNLLTDIFIIVVTKYLFHYMDFLYEYETYIILT